jgi:hypothetical protein
VQVSDDVDHQMMTVPSPLAAAGHWVLGHFGCRVPASLATGSVEPIETAMWLPVRIRLQLPVLSSGVCSPPPQLSIPGHAFGTAGPGHEL